jgi:asparagine synthase (glutamine-hydrolysing)
VCGIVGWVDWQRDLRAERATVVTMTETMACRGPDAQGEWISPRAALGHRRLAVIDLVGGAQPMSATHPAGTRGAGDTVVLTFCGELYNFVELRHELVGHGHRFRTSSDTEVLLHAYLQWGADCVGRFNGMFAFAIWDETTQELLLARDRLGIKPLYYHAYEHGALFGSEPKALLANPQFQAEIDDVGLMELFAMFGSQTPGDAVFRGLREVSPGCTVHIDVRGVRERRYWELVSRPHTDDPPTTVRTVREILADTVERQLVSDVPLCALVSGGLDSSAIAALATDSMRRRGHGELATYTVDFRDSAANFTADAMRPSLDAPHVRTLVEHLGPRHTDVLLDPPNLLATQAIATRARDLPSLGDLDASLYLLCKAVREHSTVALSGESADEVFGGYPWFHDAAAIARPALPWAVPDEGFARILAPDIRTRIRAAEYVGDRYADALAEVPRLAGETGHDRRMREVSYLALTRFLPVLLDRKDRMSMATGLEVRVPFCDHRLVEYLWNVPWRLKCADGVPKSLLRSAVADLLPATLVHRAKSSFPEAANPAYDATLRAIVMGLVSGDSAISPLLDHARVTALVDGSTGRSPWQARMALAYLIQLDLWLTTYRIRVLTTV